ncbi:Pectinesterase inhibitor [Linum grandiflorum]
MAMLPFLLLLLLICITTTTPSAAVDIVPICDETSDKAFCLRFLNSTRAAKPSADLAEAGKIALAISRRSASRNRRYIKYLVAHATSNSSSGGDVRGRYKTCLALYSNAGKSISRAKQSFAAEDYDSANVYAGAARSYADTCEEELVGLGGHKKVHETHRLLFNVLDIVLVVTNKLLRGS